MVSEIEKLAEGMVGRIPVRNLWFLMLYASELVRFPEHFKGMTDQNPAELPDLVARLLTHTVQKRLRKKLTPSYTPKSAVLSRVRGRIDFRTTETRQLLSKGQIGCSYHELTVNTPRNRMVRAALELLRRIAQDTEVARMCRCLARQLGEMGISATVPSKGELAKEQFGRSDSQDQLMISLAKLAFNLALPTEEAGPQSSYSPDREERWVRSLFERAVFGFARFELTPQGCCVARGRVLNWQFSGDNILPRMVTDIVIDSPLGHRLVIDTKFTSVMTVNRFGGESLKSNYIYQLYAYLRSQEELEPAWEKAAGMLLHPTVDEGLNERVVVQGHPLRFATIDLRSPALEIRGRLLSLLKEACYDSETIAVESPSLLSKA